MRRLDKQRKQLLEAFKIELGEWPDEKLNSYMDRAYALMTAAGRGVIEDGRAFSLPRGLTFPEVVLFKAISDPTLLFELPSPRGGKVMDHLPPDYAKPHPLYPRHRGHHPWGDEVSANQLPYDLPLAVKQGFAKRNYEEAVGLFEFDRSPANFVRLLIAEAQYTLLHRWEEKLSRPRRPMTREQLIDGLADFFVFADDAIRGDAERARRRRKWEMERAA